MIQRHKERLSLMSTDISGFIWINEDFRNKIFLNCKKLEWVSLYPNIILQLYKEGCLPILQDFEARNLKYFLENKSELKKTDPDMYNLFKIKSNMLFGDLYKREHRHNSLIIQYIKLYYNELLQNNPNIFYVDVDVVYYTGEIDYFDLLDLGVEYNICDVDSFIFSAKKRYIEITNSGTQIIGYLRRNDLSLDKNIEIEGQLYSVDDLISQMKGLLREQQINSVIN
jgi:hypothetical protein